MLIDLMGLHTKKKKEDVYVWSYYVTAHKKFTINLKLIITVQINQGQMQDFGQGVIIGL
jgi:hypothetical protein